MENEIKVNEYVRTKDGYIAKYVKDGLRSGTIDIEDNTVSWVVDNSNILKHSEKLIDLIQCGDYVNGEYVIHIDNNTKTYGEKTIITELNKRYFESQIIKVATKEMMESISYKVETY